MTTCRDVLSRSRHTRRQDRIKFHIIQHIILTFTYSTHTIPCPDSDRSDTTGVTVTPPTRSSPVINRFSPTLRWLYLVERFTRRSVVSVLRCKKLLNKNIITIPRVMVSSIRLHHRFRGSHRGVSV